MATFLDRIRQDNDFATDGGVIFYGELQRWLDLYAAGLASAGDIKTYYSMTTAQGAQFDAILATQPSSGLLPTLLNAKAISQWPNKVASVLGQAQSYCGGMTTDAATKTALGIS